MKLLTVGLVLFSFSALAQPLQFDLKGFQFSYDAPRGTGTAESFWRNMKLAESAVTVDVEKVEETFSIHITGAENHDFQVKDLPGFVKEADHMSLSGMNFTFKESLQLTLAAGEFLSPKDELRLDGLQLLCARVPEHTAVMDQVLAGCVNSLNLTSSKFSQKSARRLLALMVGGEKGDVSVKKLNFTSHAGSYDLTAEVKADVSGKLKSHGQLAYDAGTGILTVKISEVKFGILNVKKMVFDELRKQQSETLRVEEPYVYLKVK